MKLTIKIALVDDQHLFRNVLATALASDGRFDVVMETADGYILLEHLAAGHSMPDLAVIDMAMPTINGPELTQRLQKQYPQIKIVILSINYRESLIAKMIDTGASAFLNKNCDLETLKHAIEQVHQTGFYIDSSTMRALKTRPLRSKTAYKENAPPIDLTKREIEILELICQEYNNHEIAERLFISARTAEGHRNNLLLKTGCKNTAGLVVFAIKHDLFDVLK